MKKRLNEFFRYIGLLLMGVAILYFIIKYGSELKNINIGVLKNYILSYGNISIIIFILIYSLKPVIIFFPTWVLSVLAGNLYGAYMGTILNMFCCFTSATVGFYLARYLGKPFVDKILKGKVIKLDDGIEKHGFIIMLLMRLSCVFPYDGLSYASGLTKMKYRDFILGTVLGVFPEMVAYAFMGENVRNPLSTKFILPILLVILVALISSYTYKRYGEKS